MKRLVLVAYPKEGQEKQRVLRLLPHNISCYDFGLTGMEVDRIDDDHIVYKSKERLRIIDFGDKVQIESQESAYFLHICSFLNDFKIKYELIHVYDNHFRENCLSINDENFEDIFDTCYDDAFSYFGDKPEHDTNISPFS
ncbi:hypothetical protein KJ877_08880 [bacterium]|nr:hypothetical protein [bacterium]MBU1990811.1 hypothetical protein [bacterium]